MEKKKVQQRRISDAEFSALKGTFAENDQLLFAMRKAMFFMELTDEDTAVLKALSSPDVQAVVSKIFKPVLSADVPLQQNIDLWMTIEVKELDPWHTWVQVRGRQLFLNLLDEGLKAIFGKKADKIQIADFSPTQNIPAHDSPHFQEEMAEISARNTYVTHVEQQLSQIRTLAGLKGETSEETLKRLEKSSSK